MTNEQIDQYIANNPIELNLDEAIAFQTWAIGLADLFRSAVDVNVSFGPQAGFVWGTGIRFGGTEPPRVYWRLHHLRGWSNETQRKLQPGSPGTSHSNGARTA